MGFSSISFQNLTRGENVELKELLDIANEGYPDGYLSHYYDDGNLLDGHGDTLARFIVIEIIETYAPGESDREQLDTAITAIERAKKDTEGVIRALKRRKRPLKWAVGKATDGFSPGADRTGDPWWC
ncbi:hypothetical protein AKJ38_00560 [candidate division MSBL1 archaeon SCGC-AAA259I14]|uniref:Uncharacterized protein n=1 Tax=candidate division MSBL1 archaeon SCGC-AAA259I14 TaxID=1698268 RepID=A0A133UU85_9EURY|nr:hypothetical protein AKJ38_00560 [candidate division MSBL1 archaeon SCGC-AAA259I14]